MNYEFLGITWAAFENLWVVAVAFCIVFFLSVQHHMLQRFVRTLVAHKWSPLLFPGYSSLKKRIKIFLLSLGLVSLSVALLAPQWDKKEEKVEQEGRELFIALDISRSMLAGDVQPNRLAFAKSKIKRLLQLLPSERVGLVVFSGDAFVQCPLTKDKTAFNLFLDAVDAETLSSGTTSISQALHTIIQTFKQLPGARKNKIVVLFTDGEDFSSGLSELKQEAHSLGLHVFTYGVGTEEGAPVPLIDQDGKVKGHQKDEQGKIVISKLNPGILQSLAHDTGGMYIHPTQGSQDLETLVKQVERYEKEKFEAKEIDRYQEQYVYFVAVSFVALLVEWLL